MTVSELIKELGKMPQDKDVIINRAFHYSIKEMFYNEKYDYVVIID